jgi:hypothetical protein
MAKAARRKPRRPFIDAAQAAKLLRCDPRTVRRMVTDGRLQGERARSANGHHSDWRVFADQPLIVQAREAAAAAFSAARTAEVSGSGATGGDLSRENAELRMQLAEVLVVKAEERARSAEAQNSQIVAALHAMNEVLGEFQKGAELAQRSNEHFQSGSTAMSRVMSALLDTIASTNTPDSPEDL